MNHYSTTDLCMLGFALTIIGLTIGFCLGYLACMREITRQLHRSVNKVCLGEKGVPLPLLDAPVDMKPPPRMYTVGGIIKSVYMSASPGPHVLNGEPTVISLDQLMLDLDTGSSYTIPPDIKITFRYQNLTTNEFFDLWATKLFNQEIRANLSIADDKVIHVFLHQAGTAND